ncbi:ERVV2 protein, partial [Callaeas wilsoni]|nr:ERVV2 protein [Callaeas wilsoni]
TGFHTFVRWVLPQLGVSELEKTAVNISSVTEKMGNLTRDAIQAMQEKINSLKTITAQNRLGLDLLLAKEGRLCTVINQSCCTYINNQKRVETDLH